MTHWAQPTNSPIILIGPRAAGKSTLAEVLSRRLSLPDYALDIRCWQHYATDSQFYDAASQCGLLEDALNPSYATNFRAFHTVWRLLEHKIGPRYYDYEEDLHATAAFRELELWANVNCVIHFGSGHFPSLSTRRIQEMLVRLRSFTQVFLVMPSPSVDMCVKTLAPRMSCEPDLHPMAVESEVMRFKALEAIFSPVYTEGRTPSECAEEVLKMLRR